MAAPLGVGAVVGTAVAVLNVEGDVAGAMAHSCVWLAAVVARTGVLVFGVVGEALWVPPVDGDQFLFFDAEAGGVAAYRSVCFDGPAVALFSLVAGGLFARTTYALTVDRAGCV